MRRIQRKPARQMRAKMVDQQPVSGDLNLQTVVTILGSVTGIIVAVLWIAGRFYMEGYFGAMNIPLFQTNFSVWEYAEASWLRLIFYFLRRMYPLLLLVAVVPLAMLFSVFILQKIFPRLKTVDAVNQFVSAISRIRPGRSYVAMFTILFIFSYILLETFIDINKAGEMDGQKAVLSGSYAVQVYSSAYLPLGSPKAMSDTNPTVLEYSGLRLLTFNNGRYYLFRDIDPNTCKPSQVFVVTDSPDIVLVFRPVAPIAAPCAATDQ